MSFLILFLSICLLHVVHAIEVTPNSDCASFCITDPSLDPSASLSSSTQTGDLVCDDWELDGSNSTQKGRTFHDCLQCESNSTAGDKVSKENDVYWFLFNMKFTIDWCIFSYEDNNQTVQSRACSDTCAGPASAMKLAMVDRVLQTNSTIQYQYCKDGSEAFTKNVDDCMSCLQDVPSSMALVNYLRAMKAGCEQQPKIGGHIPVKLNFELYDLNPTPTSTSVASSSSPLSSSAPSSSSLSSSAATVTVTSAPAASSFPSSSSIPSSGHNRTLKLGLGLGLGLGLSLPLLLAALLIFFFRRRRCLPSQTSELETQYSPRRLEKDSTASTHPSQPAEMQAAAENFVHEADDGKPAVPEKDRWLVTPSSRSRMSSIGGEEKDERGELPGYERRGELPGLDRRGELDGEERGWHDGRREENRPGWGLRRGS